MMERPVPDLAELARMRVGLLGFGRSGQAAARALRAQNAGADLTVLAESGRANSDLPVRIAPFDERLQEFDALIRSPGVPVDHPALRAARAAGTAVINPISLWLAHRPAGLPVIGVTGSKGKSTTAALLAQLLRADGRRVLLAGNIGVPVLDHLATTAEVAVLELSSYQLADLAGRLDLGLFTRLFPEHLDWHGGEAAYIAAKLRLAELLQGRPLIINACDPKLHAATEGIAGRLAGNQPPLAHRAGTELRLEGSVLLQAGELALIGRHNLDNAALAVQAAHLLGVSRVHLQAGLRAFTALPHRLEPAGEIDGHLCINDSISTNPWSVLAALQALSDRPVVLIVGGQARTTSWEGVADWVRAHGLAGLVTLPDNGAEIAQQLSGSGMLAASTIRHCKDLAQALDAALELAPPDAVVLLSPGAPSFSQFRDFEHRGARFRAEVQLRMNASTAGQR